MSWLKPMFSMSLLVAVLNLVQSVLTYQTSVYVIGFLAVVKEGQKQQMTFRWNSIKSIHIRAMERGREWIFRHALTALTLLSRTVTNLSFKWHVGVFLHLPVLQPHLISYCFQAFAIPGQYAFAHQDVSMFIRVTDICPNDLLPPTPSKSPLSPLCTLLCEDLTIITLISWHY